MTLTQINRAGLDAEALDRVFTIGASGSSAYTFQGEGLNGTVNNPTLYLTRGKTYRFENGSGGHPIRIQSTSGASGTAYNTGVTNNAGSGTVIVEVQHDAPDVLYYQCTSHAAMNGILYITGALADGGVTTAKIADGAVTGIKIAGNTIGHDKIIDGHIGTNKLADGAVTAAKLASGVQTTINNNADNRVITGSGTANTLNGEANLTFDGGNLISKGDNGITIEATSTNTAGQLTIIGVNNNNNISAISRIKSISTDSSSAATATTFSNRNSSNAVNEHMRIDSSGRLLLGSGAIDLPKGSGAGSFDLDNGNITMCIGGNSNSTGRTNSTDKINRITSPHYTNAEEAVALLSSFNISGSNSISYGGGSGQTNAVTQHLFYTAANTTTTTGTERMRIDSSGNVGIGTTNPDSKLKIQDSSDLAIHLLKTGSQDTLIRNTGQTEICAATGGSSGQRIAFKIGASTGSLSDVAKFTPSGLCFGSDTAAANALDDYEEGTWTPGIDRNALSMSGVTYNHNTGTYTKIGRLVMVWFDLEVSANGTSGLGVPYISGLPFTALVGSGGSNNNGGYGAPSFRDATLVGSGFRIQGSSSYVQGNQIYLYNYNSSGDQVSSSLNSSGRLTGQAFYFTS